MNDEARELYIESEFGPRLPVAENAPIHEAVEGFFDVVVMLGDALVGCECCQVPETIEEAEQALVSYVYWIRAPNIVFGSAECAGMFMLSMRRQIGVRPASCDLCEARQGMIEVVLVHNMLIVMVICAQCAGHPHANAHLN